MDSMTRQGPGAAIAVCQKQAPAIAKAVSEEQGLDIGRTGVRLRNPGNVAPAWAEELVRDKIDTPTFVTLDNSRNSIQAIKPPDSKKGNCVAGSGLIYRIAKQMSS